MRKNNDKKEDRKYRPTRIWTLRGLKAKKDLANGGVAGEAVGVLVDGQGRWLVGTDLKHGAPLQIKLSILWQTLVCPLTRQKA